MERKDAITVKGNPVTLLGDEVKIGEAAPAFSVVDADLAKVDSGKFDGKIRVICSVPSLDTPVCDTEIKRFNDEASQVSKDVVIMFISMDLPFAQKRFCQEYSIKKVKTFSDHRDGDFGIKYGVLIKELRLLARAVFIIGGDGTVKYVEYVSELSSPPDYDKALDALKGMTDRA